MIGQKKSRNEVFILGAEALGDEAVAEPKSAAMTALTVHDGGEQSGDAAFNVGEVAIASQGISAGVAAEPADVRTPRLGRLLGGLAYGTGGVAVIALLFSAAQLGGRPTSESPPQAQPVVAARPPVPQPQPVVSTKLAAKTPKRDSRARTTRARERQRPDREASSSPAPSAPVPSGPVVASSSPPPQGGGFGGRETFVFEK